MGKFLKGAKAFDSSVTDVSLYDLPFDFQPVSFDIYDAAEPGTLAFLDTVAKCIASRSATSVGRSRRIFRQQLC